MAVNFLSDPKIGNYNEISRVMANSLISFGTLYRG